MDVKTATRVLDVFNLFAEVQRPMIYSEIAAHMGIPLSSCHALLKTMVARGYLYELGKKDGYYPTQKLLHVANVICKRDPLVTALEPLLMNLRDKSRETAILAKLADQAVVYLSVVESTETIRYSHQPGGFKSLHATSSGKALLAVLKRGERHALLSRYTDWSGITPNTLTSREALETDIEAGNQRGWHRSVGENVEDVMSIALGFRVHEQPFAIVLAGPVTRMQKKEEDIARLFPEVKVQLKEILKNTSVTYGSGDTQDE